MESKCVKWQLIKLARHLVAAHLILILRNLMGVCILRHIFRMHVNTVGTDNIKEHTPAHFIIISVPVCGFSFVQIFVHSHPIHHLHSALTYLCLHSVLYALFGPL